MLFLEFHIPGCSDECFDIRVAELSRAEALSSELATVIGGDVGICRRAGFNGVASDFFSFPLFSPSGLRKINMPCAPLEIQQDDPV